MKKIIISVFTFTFVAISSISGQLTPVEKGLQAITMDAIQAQLGFLASDLTEGRKAGEKGEFLSSDYIASMLKLYGVKPGGDQFQTRNLTDNKSISERSYFQTFLLQKSVPGDQQMLEVKAIDGQTTKTNSFTYGVDFTLRASSSDVGIEAPVVFAGYGYKNDMLNFNDFNKLDIKGKFILRISGIPGFARKQITQADTYSSEREMENIARTGGAAGIIEFYPNSTIAGYIERMDFNNMSPSENAPRPAQTNALYTLPGKKSIDNLIRITVSVRTANEILKGTGISIEEYISKADANMPYDLLPVTGKSIILKSPVNVSAIAVRNVIGIIEGNNPDNIIVLGAHYDHMGMNNGYIWNGADDNGSGTVGVMTLARAIMETGKKPEKTIIIALWTAEEEGLLGSRYYVQNLPYPLKNLKLNVNFDMISRYIADNEPKKVTMTYTSSCTGFKDMTVANLKKYGIDLIVDYQPSADPPGGSDHRSFVAAGVPIMRFKPGHREEYHTPDDEISTINWDIMEKIIRISFANVWELANSEW